MASQRTSAAGVSRGLFRNLVDHSFLNLVKELAIAEFKQRDQSSFLGFLWTLLHPLLVFLVIYALFAKWTGRHVELFPLYLMVGLVQWNYFAKATTSGLGSVASRPNLVTNFIFPREALVFSTVFANLIIHVMELSVFCLFALILGAEPAWTWLYLPLAVALQTVLVLAVSLFLAWLAVGYKDIVRIWEVVTFAGFFVTPIFYPLEIISPEKQVIMKLNPMLHLIMETRKFLIYDRQPSHGTLVFLALLSGLLFWAAYRIFKAGEHRFAEKFP
jgi:lipopolysaccharide transport system permease protein